MSACGVCQGSSVIGTFGSPRPCPACNGTGRCQECTRLREALLCVIADPGHAVEIAKDALR